MFLLPLQLNVFHKLTVHSSVAYSTPSMKISQKSVQNFFVLATKQTLPITSFVNGPLSGTVFLCRL